jgi:hypothetical protein
LIPGRTLIFGDSFTEAAQPFFLSYFADVTLMRFNDFSAEKYIETDEHENNRILHKFKNGNYIINLSPKELYLEGKEMANCIGDMTYGIIDKTISILALKDKKNKTLVHLQVNKLGFLEQHYSKANTAVSSERWKYINEFFDIYKDEQFSEKINSTNIDINYNISNQTHNFVPVVEYFIPTKVTNSIYAPEALKINETYHIKDFINTTQFDRFNKGKHLSKDELFDYLNDFKGYINKSIDNILDFVNISHKNYYNLNNTMSQKIFESKTPKIDEKISNSSKGENNPNYGGKFKTDEWVQKQVISNSKKPLKVIDTLTEEILIFINSKGVADFIGCSDSMVRNSKKNGWKIKKQYLIKDIN